MRHVHYIQARCRYSAEQWLALGSTTILALRSSDSDLQRRSYNLVLDHLRNNRRSRHRHFWKLRQSRAVVTGFQNLDQRTWERATKLLKLYHAMLELAHTEGPRCCAFQWTMDGHRSPVAVESAAHSVVSDGPVVWSDRQQSTGASFLQLDDIQKLGYADLSRRGCKPSIHRASYISARERKHWQYERNQRCPGCLLRPR